MEIEGIEVCKPIVKLLDVLSGLGFEIVEQKISDYHFHEFYFKMKGKYLEEIEDINIDKITMKSKDFFYCQCHWSVVELIYV